MTSSEKEEEIIMYIIVNQDLGMGKGKIGGQTAHSACRTTRLLERSLPLSNTYTRWIDSGEPKIVVKSNEKDMLECIDKYPPYKDHLWCTYTRDFGKTQIAANSLTTVAFAPIQRKYIPMLIRNLKLL